MDTRLERRLLALILEAEVIYDSEASWQYKYDRIFGLWRNQIGPLMQEANLKLEWYDPDASYQEDVVAFMNALVEMSKEMRAVEESWAKRESES